MRQLVYFHGGRRGRATVIELRESHVAVRLKAPLPGDVPADSKLADLAGTAVEIALDFSNVGAYLLRTQPDTDQEAVRGQLSVRTDVAAAEPAAFDCRIQRFVVSAGQVVVRAKSTLSPATARRLIREPRTSRAVHPLPFARNAFLWSRPASTLEELCADCAEFLRDPRVVEAYPVVWDKGQASSEETWHLQGSTQRYATGAVPDAGAGVAAAHGMGYRGQGMRVAVIDPLGINAGHRDFQGRVVCDLDVTAWPTQIRNSASSPTPTAALADHGTMCAGAALGGRAGVAPEAKLIALRDASPLESVAGAYALYLAVKMRADVIACPWSGPVSTTYPHALPPHMDWARDYTLRNGRRRSGAARGTPIVFSAGNSDSSLELDEFVSDPRVMAIGASNWLGERSLSRRGRNLLGLAPTGDTRWGNEPAADAQAALTHGCVFAPGKNGRREGDSCRAVSAEQDGYDWWGGGTSFAASAAAGVIALVLQANPRLTVPTLRRHLARSCKASVGQPTRWPRHEPAFGFGRLNAAAAIELALGRRSSPTGRHGA